LFDDHGAVVHDLKIRSDWGPDEANTYSGYSGLQNFGHDGTTRGGVVYVHINHEMMELLARILKMQGLRGLSIKQ